MAFQIEDIVCLVDTDSTVSQKLHKYLHLSRLFWYIASIIIT